MGRLETVLGQTLGLVPGQAGGLLKDEVHLATEAERCRTKSCSRLRRPGGYLGGVHIST